MKLFILGLIILLILVCQIYKIIKEKDHKINEDNNIENMTDDEENELGEEKNAMPAADFNSFLDHREKFNKDTIRYYHELMEGKLDTKLEKKVGTDFLYLDGKNRLIFDDYDAYMKTKSFEGFTEGKK